MAKKRAKSPEPTMSDNAAAVRGARWWTKPKAEPQRVLGAVSGMVKCLWDEDAGRRLDAQRNLARWGLDLNGLYGRPMGLLPKRTALKVNLTKSLTETIVAKIGKQRPRPLFLTDGGSYGLQQRAKKLQRFIDAVYNAVGVYSVTPLVFRNAMLFGTGVFGPGGEAHHPRGPRFTLDNVFPLEILVDQVEAVSGKPQSMYRVHPVAKDHLQNQHPEHVDAIEDAGLCAPDGELPGSEGGVAHDPRVAVVYEAWHLSDFDADGTPIPGRHVVVCGEAVLVDEEYEEEDFPFLFQHWNPPVRGFWGDSAVGEIRGLEQEVNVLLQRAQDAMKRSGMPFLLSHVDANLKEGKLSNEPGVHYRYEGQIKPEIVTGQPVHPQILDQAWQLRRVAAEQLGTNELQVSATKPAGVESGRALEQLSEEHAVRFETVSRDFERNIAVNLAAHFVRVARVMDAQLKAAGKAGLRLRAVHERDVIDLKWDEAALQPEELFIDTYPVSVLPNTPAGKTAEVERWQANQWITPARSRELLEFPDLEEERSVLNASAELLDWQLAEMLDHGRSVMPNRRQDLQEAVTRGTMALLRAVRTNVPADNTALLEDFLAVIDEWLTPPPAPVPPPPMPAMGATPAVGGLAPAAPMPSMDPSMMPPAM